MAGKLTQNEQIKQEREARYLLIQRASEGDEEAQKLLADPPYRLRVYTPQERDTYIKKNKPQS